MSDEGPKLFTNKPKKSKLKTSTPITTASSSSMGAAAPPPPPPPQPQDSFRLRYKFFGKLLLGISFVTGAYALMRTTMLNKGTPEEEKHDHPTSSTSTAPPPAPAITEKPVSAPIVEPVKRPPIPEDQQRELFKWMLEEKRKVKPRDAEEKKRIDEEKALLKQLIRAKSLPSI